MWQKFKMLYKRIPQSLNVMTFNSLNNSLQNSLNSKVYYTPKLQKIPFTEELAKYLRYIDRKDKIKTSDLRGMVEAILTEYGAILEQEGQQPLNKNTDYFITRGYKFVQNELSPYHGTTDYMVWLNDRHFVPVYFNEGEINEVAGMALAHATMALKCMARNDLKNSGYSIVTTGQEWQMFKVYSSQRAQKTVIYEGRNRFRNIVKDYEMIEVVMGLLDQCLQTERDEVKLLRLAYDVIDERKYMLQASSLQQARKVSPVGRWLTRYFQKKKDSTSK